MIQSFWPAQFWVTIGMAAAAASIVTFRVGRGYVRRNPVLRFGRLGTTALLTLLWIAVFIPIARLSLYAWA